MAPLSFSGKKPDRGGKNFKKRSEKDSSRTARAKPDRARSDRPKPDRRKPELKERQDRRYREFAVPPLPVDITGDELEKKRRFQLQPLAPENAEVVAKHLVAIERFLESEPDLAYRHGQEATYRAGRIAIVRELAGLAALRSGRYEIAQKDLRAASRISGSKEVLPFIAQCEVALGNPRKALEIAGSVEPRTLSAAGRVELRIAAAAARSALGQFDAAVVTLRCEELNESEAPWSSRLRTAYYKALSSAGKNNEAQSFRERFPQSIVSEAL